MEDILVKLRINEYYHGIVNAYQNAHYMVGIIIDTPVLNDEEMNRIEMIWLDLKSKNLEAQLTEAMKGLLDVSKLDNIDYDGDGIRTNAEVISRLKQEIASCQETKKRIERYYKFDFNNDMFLKNIYRACIMNNGQERLSNESIVFSDADLQELRCAILVFLVAKKRYELAEQKKELEFDLEFDEKRKNRYDNDTQNDKVMIARLEREIAECKKESEEIREKLISRNNGSSR